MLSPIITQEDFFVNGESKELTEIYSFSFAWI